MPDPYRIDFARAALPRLRLLTADEKTRLDAMLGEIAGEMLALGARGDVPTGPALPDADELLSLSVGRATVRYAVNTEERTVTVKHILVSTHPPFAVIWTPQAGAQMSSIHPAIREHIVKQIEQVAALAGAEVRLRTAYANEPPRERVWTFEGHTVVYTLDDGRFAVTVVQVVGPGTRSTG